MRFTCLVVGLEIPTSSEQLTRGLVQKFNLATVFKHTISFACMLGQAIWSSSGGLPGKFLLGMLQGGGSSQCTCTHLCIHI